MLTTSPDPPSPSPPSPDRPLPAVWRRRDLLWAVLAVALALAAFAGTVTGSFLADDFTIVDAVREDGAFARWAGQGEPFFRPLVSLLFFLDFQVWGLDPRGFHLTNLFLHGLASVLLGFAAGRLAGRWPSVSSDQARSLGLVAGLLFLVHPSHLEPVAWIAGRSDLLAAVFALACLGFHLQARSRTTVALSALALAGALASKESALTLPLALFALEAVMAEGQTLRQRLLYALRATVHLLALLPLYFLVRWRVLGAAVGGYGGEVHLAADPVLLLDNLFGHFSRSLLPRLGGAQLPDGAVAVLGLAVAAGFWWIRRRRPPSPEDRSWRGLLAAAMLLFVVTVLPALNLRVAPDSTLTERILYLPSAFVAVFAAALVHLAVQRPALQRGLASAVAAVLSLLLVLGWQPWRQAATATETIMDAFLEPAPKGRVYLLGAPDNVDGAYALRNGVQAAMRLAGRTGQPPIVVNRLDLPDLSAEIRVHRQGKTFTVAARGPAKVFMRPVRGAPEVFRPIFNERRRQRFALPKLSPQDRVLVFSGGEVETLQPGLPPGR